jgi:hypothetical protein
MPQTRFQKNLLKDKREISPPPQPAKKSNRGRKPKAVTPTAINEPINTIESTRNK